MHFPLSISEGCHWKSDSTIHTNNRYFLTPEKIDCLHNLHRENEIAQRKMGIVLELSITASHSVSLEDNISSDIHLIVEEEEQ